MSESAVTEMWLTQEQAMASLKRSERTVQVLAKAGEIEKRVELPRTPLNPGPNTVPLYSAASVEAYKARQNGTAVVHVPRGQEPLPEPAVTPEPEEDEVDVATLPAAAYVTVREAARYLRMPQPWVKAAIESGRLPFEKAFGAYRVRRVDLDGLPASQRYLRG